jgi:hypothetical protein
MSESGDPNALYAQHPQRSSSIPGWMGRRIEIPLTPELVTMQPKYYYPVYQRLEWYELLGSEGNNLKKTK